MSSIPGAVFAMAGADVLKEFSGNSTWMKRLELYFDKSSFSVIISALEASDVFFAVLSYLKDQYPDTFHRMSIHTIQRQDGPRSRDTISYEWVPGKGFNCFSFEGATITFERQNRSQNANSGEGPDEIKLETDIESKDKLKTLIDHAVHYQTTKLSNLIRIYRSTGSSWKLACTQKPKDPNCFVWTHELRGFHESAISFLKPETRDFYVSTDCPYRRGYLLYGPPGTGKSSIVLQLATYMKMPVYLLSLQHLSNDELRKLLLAVPPGSIVLIEDIDAAGVAQDHQKNHLKQIKQSTSVTIDGLLNAFEGVDSFAGSVLIMTTNYKEILDPRLIRTGRADERIFVGGIREDGIAALLHIFFSQFTPDTTEFQTQIKKLFFDHYPGVTSTPFSLPIADVRGFFLSMIMEADRNFPVAWEKIRNGFPTHFREKHQEFLQKNPQPADDTI